MRLLVPLLTCFAFSAASPFLVDQAAIAASEAGQPDSTNSTGATDSSSTAKFFSRSGSPASELPTTLSPASSEPKAGARIPVSPAAAPAITLFGGVSHSDSMEHVKHSLDKQRKVLQPSIASTDKSNESSVSKNDIVASAQSTGPLQAGTKQAQLGYVPLNGIAQTSSAESKTLSGQLQKYTLEWFMIPKWLAGKWEKSGDLTVSITDLKTGQQTYPNSWTENEQESTWGHQADAAGNIWHVNFLPAEKDGKSEGRLVRFLTVMQKCEKTDEHQGLITRTQYVVSEANFWTGDEADMFQQESLNHYMQTNPHEVLNESTNRVFSYGGEAVRDGHLQTRFNKTAEFFPTPEINSIDLRLALNDYLEAHGLTQLMNK